MLAHMCFLSLLLIITYLIFPYILSDEWALYINNRAATFQYSDGPPLSCRFDPANPHIQLGESEPSLDNSADPIGMNIFLQFQLLVYI